MAITDLSYTAWEFNETPELTGVFRYEINYHSYTNSMGMRTVLRCADYYSRGWALYSEDGSGSYFYYPTYSGGYYWSSYFRKIMIMGGADATNPELIAWLTANATQIDGVLKAIAPAFKRTADAIRTKRGASSSTSYTWDERDGFYSAISAIYLGTDTRSGNATPADIKAGVVAFSNEKTVNGALGSAEGVMF